MTKNDLEGLDKDKITKIKKIWFPPSERTGTLWDDYMEVIPIVAMYGKKIMDFDEDGPEFKRAVSDFEKQFRPGERAC